jgi:hypothetical protein
MTENTFPVFRPMKLAELLDQAIRLYRRNFLQFIGIIAVPYIPLMMFQALSSILVASSLQGLASSSASSPLGIFSDGRYWLGLSGTFLFFILYLFLILGLATAALTRAISDSYSGEPVGIFSSYRRLGGSPLRLIGALFWLGLIGFGLIIWTIIPCVGWVSGPGLLIFISWIVLPLVAPVVVLENNGALASVRRAWDLSRTRFWWLIGFALILYLFSTLVISGPTLLISSALRYFMVSTSNPLNQQLMLTTVVQTLVTMITGLLYLPLQLSAITVVYFDLRVRSEGLDLALQAAPSGENASFNALAAAPSGPQPRLVSGKDVGNFVLFTLGFYALYALLVGIFFGLGMALVPLLTPR